MNFEEYQEFTKTTAIYPENLALEYLGLGLVSEAGEVAGVIKKKVRDNTYSLEVKQRLKEELGDVMWYVAQLCLIYDIDFESMLRYNASKLKSRQNRGVLSGNGDYR